MEKDNLILLDYKDNFADNLSLIAYGKILENKTGKKCFYENLPDKRERFEKVFSDFNLNFNYISSRRASIAKDNSVNLSNYPKYKKELKKKHFRNNDNFLSINHFEIHDLSYISNEIKNMFKFSNLDFIVNYDILEEINQTNSIGLYLNKNDIENLDFNYIYNATKRLNKYIKQPKLFIFSTPNIEDKIKSFIPYKIIHLNDWREEFYFLKNCPHNIILNTPNSYSEGLWAAILSQKSYSINIISKNANTKQETKNWISI